MFLFYIGAELICIVALVPGAQQSDSAMEIHIYLFSFKSSPMQAATECWVVACATW